MGLPSVKASNRGSFGYLLVCKNIKYLVDSVDARRQVENPSASAD
jgi:hypothetical protein